MKTNEKSWINVVKGIGILLMVVGHAGVSDSIRVWIYGFHMPLFFVVAGYLFDYKKWRQKGFVALLRSRANAYLIPYTVLFCINFICWLLLNIISGRTLEAKTVIFWLLAGAYSHDTMMPNCAPLWFLTCLFVSYIFFWILVIQEKKLKQIAISVCYIMILFILCKIESCNNITQLPWHVDVAFIASVFMLVGYYLKEVELKLANIKKVYRVSGCFILFCMMSLAIMINGQINMVQNQYQNTIMFLLVASVMSIVIMMLVKDTEIIIKKYSLYKICEYWGRNSIVFIGFNYLFNVVVRQVLNMMNFRNSVVYSIVDIFVVLIGCTGIAMCRNKIKTMRSVAKRASI